MEGKESSTCSTGSDVGIVSSEDDDDIIDKSVKKMVSEIINKKV